MTNLNNFSNFELSTEETINVNGGRCSSNRRSSKRNIDCSRSYSSCCSENCEPTVEESSVEEVIIEVAPVEEAPALRFVGLQGA